MDNRLPDSDVRDYDSTGSEMEGILNFQRSRFAKSALDVTRGFAAVRLYPNKRPNYGSNYQPRSKFIASVRLIPNSSPIRRSERPRVDPMLSLPVTPKFL